ncbi:MAG: carboxyvinyl-carboxyphosphonate phosphorylmutase [Alphaproteobacteria bacterium]|jgi:2-methylisocitrate lyase-like PEP mutase family enzyme|nr:carboxyvinyl-carboxyphosphonate phosphorylmutase [Alphaproteobacteria bacterium]
MANATLRKQLNEGTFIMAPGIYDMISAMMADQMGFKALYVTGYGISASHLGLPDAGLMGYSDILSRVSQITERCQTPVVADADTGYGGLLNVRHTVRGYERAGVSGIQIEDQEFPKKCGHTQGRRVVPTEDMVRKIQVACEARTDENMMIIARTDSRTSLGLDEALRRSEAYAAAGADIIFLESPESIEELHVIAQRIEKPLLANLVSGGRTPVVSQTELQEIGYSMAIHPALGFLSAGFALRKGYQELAQTGDVKNQDLYDFQEFCKLVGFEDVWDFDAKWAE